MAEKNIKEKKKTEKKEKTMKVVDRVMVHGQAGNCKTRDELAKKVVKDFVDAGITYNIRGYEITDSSVLRQIGSFFKCLTNFDGNGNPRKGWWEKWQIKEDEFIVISERK